MYYVGCACMRVCVCVRARTAFDFVFWLLLMVVVVVCVGGGGGGGRVWGEVWGGGGGVPHACVCVGVNVYANSEISSFLEGPGQHGWIVVKLVRQWVGPENRYSSS